jgi:hypothetical protein
MAKKWEDFSIFKLAGGVFLEKVFWEKSTGREDCHYQAARP